MGGKEVQAIADALRRMGKGIADMNAAMKRMPDHCRDAEFFDTIRPWLASWPPCGVVYDGVSPDGVNLSGASGAQSSLLPCIDAFLGVPNLSARGGHGHCQMGGAAVVTPASTSASASQCPHASAAMASRAVERQDASKAFHAMLLGYRRHMPPAHRDLIARLEVEFARTTSDDVDGASHSAAAAAAAKKCPFAGQTIPQEAGEVWETTQVCQVIPQQKQPRAVGEPLNIRDLLSDMELRLKVLVSQEQQDHQHIQAPPSAESSEERVVGKMLKGLSVEPVALADRGRMHTANSTNSVVKIKTAYNECIEGLVAFRRYHVGLATLYISRMAAKHRRREREAAAAAAAATGSSVGGAQVVASDDNKLRMHKGGDKGTGGSNFSTHLMRHITNTRQCMYDTSVSRELAGVRGAKDAEYALPGLGRRLPHGSVFARK
jgi:hypothetical protein